MSEPDHDTPAEKEASKAQTGCGCLMLSALIVVPLYLVAHFGFGFNRESHPSTHAASPQTSSPSVKPSPSPTPVALTGYFALKKDWERAHKKRDHGGYGPNAINGDPAWQGVNFDEEQRVYTFQYNPPRATPLALARAESHLQLPPGARLIKTFAQRGCYNEQFSNPIPTAPVERLASGKPFLISLSYFSMTTPNTPLDKAHVRFVVFGPGDGSAPDCA